MIKTLTLDNLKRLNCCPEGIQVAEAHGLIGRTIKRAEGDHINYQSWFGTQPNLVKRGNFSDGVFPNGDTITWERDDYGRLLSMTHTDGTDTKYIWCNNYRRRTESLPNGNEITADFNDRGQMISESTGRSWEYNKFGWLTKVVYANGRVREYRYNSMGHVIQEITPSGEVYDYQYDWIDADTLVTYRNGEKVFEIEFEKQRAKSVGVGRNVSRETMSEIDFKKQYEQVFDDE